MAILRTAAVSTVVVVGLIAAPGTAEAEGDAKDTGAFIIGTAWNAVKISASAAGQVFGGENAPDAGTAPDTGTAPVADSNGDGDPGA